MKQINEGRWTADIEGDFVVFMIGARINPLRAVTALIDLGGRRGLNHMLKYLTEHPEKGLLGYESFGLTTTVQYWRSFELLEAFAKDESDPHLDPWRKFWKRVGKSGRTGIWHETFLVRAGEYEAVYGNMPTRGLQKASTAVRVSESSTARSRLKSARSA